MPVNLDVTLDELNISESIVKGVQANTKRDKFIKSLCDKTVEATKKKYNVLVSSLDQGHGRCLNDVVFFATAPYKVKFYLDATTPYKVNFSLEPITFRIWAFKSGEFRNIGDGGYINWIFWGRYHRSDHEGRLVRFFPLS